MLTTAQSQLSDLLEQVARSLDIPDDIPDEAVRKYEELGHWLEEKDQENGRKVPKVYPQGSFRLGTVIQPFGKDGEYDVDLVYERDLRKTSTTQEQLKEQAGEHLESFVEFLRESHRDAATLESGQRCWTLNYPDQFHMDVLPAIPNDEGHWSGGKHSTTKILITDESLREWQHSNPIGYGEWFKSRMEEQFREKRAALATEQLMSKSMPLTESMLKAAAEAIPDYKVKTPLQRAVQILKRHRDFYFAEDADNRPASIILTTLAAKAYKNEGNLVDALLNLVRGMPTHITQKFVKGNWVSWVENPVNEEENFADRWQNEEHPDRERKFREWLKKVEIDLTDAIKGGGIPKVIDLLSISLGRTVVTKAATAIGYQALQQRQSGNTRMTSGTGLLGTTGNISVKEHTFHGLDATEEN